LTKANKVEVNVSDRKNNWLVVSYCTADLGAWLLHSRKEALRRKKEIEADSSDKDAGDIELYYGKIHPSKVNGI
jgi:hypothetical protein